MVALMCKVSSECHLDINELLDNLTATKKPKSAFTSADLHFTCSDGGYKFGKWEQVGVCDQPRSAQAASYYHVIVAPGL